MKHTKKLVLAALLAALVFSATFIIQIPTPTGGYVNLGDTIVITAAWLIGPLFGGAAAAIGSALSDLIAGYTVYILPTFLIKGAMAVVAFFVYKAFSNKNALLGRIIGALAAEILMVGGYYLVEALFLGYGFAGALVGVLGNTVQGLVGVIMSVLITELLTKNKTFKKFITK